MITQRRYDFGPVLEFVRPTSVLALARTLGVHARQVYRWMHAGVPDRSADRLAVSLGLVPYLLWPEWLTGAPTPPPEDWVSRFQASRAATERAEAGRRVTARATIAAALEPRSCRRCHQPFPPHHPAQLSCSMSCAQVRRP